MRPIGCWIAAIAAIACIGAAAAAADGQEPRLTPEQQFEELLAECRAVPNPGVLTDAERVQYIGRIYRRQYEFAPRFVELAERHRDDPIAVRALIQAAWQVNNNPWPVELVGEDVASARALALLQRDHLESPDLGSLCTRIGYGHRPEYEPFLRALFSDSPHPQVKGAAGLALAHFLNQRLQRLELLELQEPSRAEFAALFGAEYLEKLLRLDRPEAAREIEALLERVSADHGAVELEYGGTVGQRAAGELFELRHLRVGATAPEIEGEDQHGVRFKLSDYRGKVVLLDFWSWV
jgi:hypothetical protein